ncbi:unnamed protein product [Mortierella alpina]
MAPLQPAPSDDRKPSADSLSSSLRTASSLDQASAAHADASTRPSSRGERRPSAGSASFAPLNGHYGHGRPSSPSTFVSHSQSPPRDEQHQQQRPRNNSHNGRTHCSIHSMPLLKPP